MNRYPGGKQPKMRDTIVPGTNQTQLMVFPDNYKGVDKDGNPTAGKPKGMEQVLAERGLLSVLEVAAKSEVGRSLVPVRCAGHHRLSARGLRRRQSHDRQRSRALSLAASLGSVFPYSTNRMEAVRPIAVCNGCSHFKMTSRMRSRCSSL